MNILNVLNKYDPNSAKPVLSPMKRSVMRFRNLRDSNSTRLPRPNTGIMLVPHPDWEPDMKGATDQHLSHATVQLQRVRPEKNERRFYAMTAALDLFGEAILIRNWGRIGTGGRLRRDLCADLNAAGEALNDLARQKRQRGYVEFSP